MDFKSKTINEISQQILSDLKESLNSPKYFMGVSPLKALAYALSGTAYMLHTHIDSVAKYQLMPDTAKGEALKRWGDILGLKKGEGRRAKGFIQIEGKKNESLSLLMSDTGKTFKATLYDESKSTYNCEALNIGYASNLSPSNTFYIPGETNPQIKILEDGINGGFDPETEDEFRSRILVACRNLFKKPSIFAL